MDATSSAATTAYDALVNRALPILALLFSTALVACGERGTIKVDPSKHGGIVIYPSSVGNRYGNTDLYAAAADGSSRRRLTNTPFVCESTPILAGDQLGFFYYSFSCPKPPEGERGGWNSNEPPALWWMRIDGSGFRKIISLGEGEWPYPSSRGDIAILSDRGLSLQRFGSDRKQVDMAVGRFGFPGWPIDRVWSDDGEFFIFSSLTSSGGAALFSLDSENMRVKRLTSPTPGEVDLTPTLSPDNRYLAYTADAEGAELHYSRPVFLLDMSTSSLKRLPGGEGWPITFTRDGSRLLYQISSPYTEKSMSYAISSGKATHIRGKLSLAFSRIEAPDGTRLLGIEPIGHKHYLVTTDRCGAHRKLLGRFVEDRDRGIEDSEAGVLGPLVAWSEPGAAVTRRPARCEAE